MDIYQIRTSKYQELVSVPGNFEYKLGDFCSVSSYSSSIAYKTVPLQTQSASFGSYIYIPETHKTLIYFNFQQYTIIEKSAIMIYIVKIRFLVELNPIKMFLLERQRRFSKLT